MSGRDKGWELYQLLFADDTDHQVVNLEKKFHCLANNQVQTSVWAEQVAGECRKEEYAEVHIESRNEIGSMEVELNGEVLKEMELQITKSKLL